MDQVCPAKLARERAGLQATVAVLSLVPITAGAAGLLLGPGFAGGPAGVPDLASHFAYLSGLLLGLGFGFLAMVPRIERQGLLFRSAAGVVVLGGLARLLGVALAGPPSASSGPGDGAWCRARDRCLANAGRAALCRKAGVGADKLAVGLPYDWEGVNTG